MMEEALLLNRQSKQVAIKEIFRKAAELLQSCGIKDPELEAERFIEHAFSVTRAELFSKDALPLVREKQDLLASLLRKRRQRFPLQYCLGEAHFMDFTFFVDERCLIPRPETELLVGKALSMIRSRNDDKDTVSILDIGTGSGNIAVSLAYYLENARCVASDVSEQPLEVAQRNALKYNVDDKIRFLKSDLFENIEPQKFDLIVSNPPYVSEEEMATLSPEVRREPFQALHGGENGVEIITRLVERARDFLKPHGELLMEIGFSQGQAVSRLCYNNGFASVKVLQDYSGLDRIVRAEING